MGCPHLPSARSAALSHRLSMRNGVLLMAADRGEIHGSCQSAETLLRARGQQIKSGEMRIVLQAGLKPDPRFPGVPFALDLDVRLSHGAPPGFCP